MNPTPPPLGVFLDESDVALQSDSRIRVDINRNHCHGYAICEQEAPEVFRLTADGRLEYQANPDAHHQQAVLQAARVCPMQAIRIGRRAT